MTFQTFKATKIKSHGLRARQKIVPTIIGLAVDGGIIAGTEFGPILVGCPIKGNISKNTSQRIYPRRDRSFTLKRGSIGFQASDGFALRRMRVRQDGGSAEARVCILRAQFTLSRPPC